MTRKSALFFLLALGGTVAFGFSVDRRLEDSSGLFAVEVGSRWGFMDSLGNMKIEPRFDEVGFFSEGLAAARTGDKWGYIDLSGKTAIPPKFDWAGEFSEGLAVAELGGRMGYLDRTGAWAIPASFDAANVFGEGFGRIRKGERWGFVDREGRQAIPLQYDDAGDFSEGAAAVKVGELWGFIDRRGAPLLSPRFGDAEEFRQGWAKVNFDGLDNFVDRGGMFLVGSPRFLEAHGFSEGMAAAISVENGKYGYLDLSGQFAIRASFDLAFVFHDGLAAVSRSGRYGFIDTNGKEVIPLRYAFADAFIGGLARVKSDDGWLYIDKEGTAVRPRANQAASRAATSDIAIRYDMAGITEVVLSGGRLEVMGSTSGADDPQGEAGPGAQARVRKTFPIRPGDAEALLQLIRESGFLDLGAAYGVPNPEERHYPTRIEVTAPGLEKSVLYRSHPNYDAPEPFRRVEEAILKLAREAAKRK